VILSMKTRDAANPRFPQQRQSAEGKADLTVYLIGTRDVSAVNIRLLNIKRYYLIIDEV